MFSKSNYRLALPLLMCLGALALSACATTTSGVGMNCPCCEHMKAGEECCCKDMKDCPCCHDSETKGKTCMPKN